MQLLLILDDAFHLITPEVTDRIAYLYTVNLGSVLCNGVFTSVDDTLGVSQTGNLVLIVREVGRDAVSEVLANLVVPRQLNLITFVLDVTTVHIRCIRSV